MDDSLVKTPVPRKSTAALSPSLDLPTLPHLVVPPFSFEQDDPDQIIPLRRSTSSKRSAIYFSPAVDLTAVPQLPSIVPRVNNAPQASLFPISNESTTRPSSAISISSVGSLPSPLFGQELVDAFPSVPATTPTNISHKLPHREKMSFATPTAASFDTALLSSAIHLASTSKMATPKASVTPLPS